MTLLLNDSINMKYMLQFTKPKFKIFSNCRPKKDLTSPIHIFGADIHVPVTEKIYYETSYFLKTITI